MNEYDKYESGMSIPEISEEMGMARSTLYFRLKNAGILRSRVEGIREAAKKGKMSHMKGKKRVFTQEWKDNMSKARTGTGKGYSLKPNGYIEITTGENKGRGQHVVFMEESIGRKLLSSECVHHKDHNKSNNILDNLELMTRSEHMRLHGKENIINRERDSLGRLK